MTWTTCYFSKIIIFVLNVIELAIELFYEILSEKLSFAPEYLCKPLLQSTLYYQRQYKLPTNHDVQRNNYALSTWIKFHAHIIFLSTGSSSLWSIIIIKINVIS